MCGGTQRWWDEARKRWAGDHRGDQARLAWWGSDSIFLTLGRMGGTGPGVSLGWLTYCLPGSLCERARGILTTLCGGFRRDYHPILQLRKSRLRELSNLLTVYTASQWRSQCGIPTADSHALLLTLHLAVPGSRQSRAQGREQNNLPGKPASEGPGEELSSPQRLPFLP